MIKIDVTSKIGGFKPVNGIDNGPVCFGSLIDSSKYYRQAGFPYCRLHDTNYPHPREVDIPTIFKDFSADENEPKNYDFRATDIYLKQILDAGAKIIYRLGVSIEHPKLKYYVNPPVDFDKWARVCLNIARHYNEGWANGFHMGIEYWEVWNEPNLGYEKREEDTMWSGTPQQYYDLYAATSRLFKKEMPYVNIGGYASAYSQSDFFPAFLQYVKANSLPLNFFSWHIYTKSIDDIVSRAHFVRENLDKFGFTDTMTILDEWNCIEWGNLWGGIFSPDGAKARYESFTETSGEVGASFAASALIEMLDLPIDIATFYDGSPTNIFGTIFDRYGVPTKQYYAFDAFNKVKQTGERVQTECDVGDVYVAAAASHNNEKICILIANNNNQNGFYQYDIEGLQENAEYLYEVYLTDKYRVFDKVDEKICTSSDIPKSVYLYQHSFALVCFTKK
ncbi:MAG: hypothetical protein FWD71_02645 [Oscillospiraceae bacterium]|nr:hypothetical protein [Oscillospiraceae bacterium]